MSATFPRTAAVLRIGRFRLDPDRFVLSGPDGEVPLRPTPLRLLLHLAQEAPRIVPRREIVREVWRGTAGPDALAAAVRDLRRALGDSARDPRYVRTLRGAGFQLVAPVGEDVDEPESRASTLIERALLALDGDPRNEPARRLLREARARLG